MVSGCHRGRSGMVSGCQPSGLEGTGKHRAVVPGWASCQKPHQTWGLPAVTLPCLRLAAVCAALAGFGRAVT